MKARNLTIALGLAVFVGYGVVSFPASIAHRWFAPAELAMTSVRGTIWRGSASHGAVAGIVFSDLSWRLNPLALLTGKLDLIVDELHIGNGSVRAQVTASRRAADITIVDAFLDLMPFRDMLSLGDVRGQISSRELTLRLVDGWPVAASGEVRIAGLAVPPQLPGTGVERVLLGNYRAEFTPTDAPGIVTLLSDEGGPLELSGTFRLTPDRVYEFDTRIRPRADAPEILLQGLEFVTGPPDGEGRRSFRQTGSL